MVVAAILANIVASVGIILVNKQIASVCGFHFLLTLLFLNFLTTGVVMAVLAKLGWFQVKHLPSRDRWLVALLAMLTVLLNNASNEANSVGFYQITKLLIIPTVMCIEALQGIERRYSGGVKASLLVASLGVAVATCSDFEMNWRGSVLAAFSVVLTAQYQMWQGSKQHEHGVSAMQITHSVTLPQSVLGCCATLVFDVGCPSLKRPLLLRPGGLLEHEMTDKWVPIWILVCCALAVLMNFSTYGLLGRTSPVTYQVVGQVKTCLIVAMGHLFFDVQTPRNWLMIRFGGVAVAVSGALCYAIIKNQEQKKAKQ